MADYRLDVMKFVREVEKFPCIYNSSLPEYSNRSETKRAWLQIAENLSWPEHEIKEKWRKIRIAFMRSLKQQYANQANKPYYLFDHLKFLLPYIKFCDSEVDQGPSPTNSDYDHLETRPHKIEIESDDSIEKHDDSHQRTSLINTENSRNDLRNDPRVNDLSNYNFYASKVTPATDPNDFESYKSMMTKKRKTDENIEDNPRKMFLLSLMPDIEDFTDEEMRSFRSGVISQIDTIMEKRKLS